MATVRSTAKTQTSNKSPQSPTAPNSTTLSKTTNISLNESGGQEDIESIAKQISDHAEAIYQTWKARGLAPTEILNCHTTTTNDFGKSLKSQSNTTKSNRKSSSPDDHSNFSNKDKNSPVTELLVNTPDMSNNNLEKLVNTFVNEDKARLAARKRNSQSTTTTTGSSTIQHAQKKIDKNDVSPTKQTSPTPVSPSSSSSSSSSSLKNNATNNTIDQVLPKNNDLTKISVRNNSNNSNNSSSNKISSTTNTTTTNTTNKLSSNPLSISPQSPQIATQQSATQQKPQTPAKPANLINHVPSWPLKNRIGSPVASSPASNATTSTPSSSSSPSSSSTIINSNTTTPSTNVIRTSKSVSPTKDILDTPSTTTNTKTTVKSSTTKSSGRRKSSEVLDEVSREEERLINALKAGQIINNDNKKSLPVVVQSTIQNDSENGTNWKKPDVSTTTSSPNTITATWNGIQLKPVSVTSSSTLAHQKIDELHNNNNVISNAYVKLNKPRAPRTENVPHPELSSSRNHGVRQTASSPVRPFLTRGSVAERVLIFERCPEIKVPPRNAVKEPTKQQQVKSIKSLPSHTTLQRHIKNSAKNVHIPRFYYPNGKPLSPISVETTLQKIQHLFNSQTNHQLPRSNINQLIEACSLPHYWRMPVFFATQLTPDGKVDGYRFVDFWKEMTSTCHDHASRFLHIFRGREKRNYLIQTDFFNLIQDLIETHPGLSFLKEATEFHSRYIHTVIARIFYCVNRSWTGRITVQELRRSNLLQVIQLLEVEEDINQITQYFSYEHFYVIYCKFWELDRDHDLQIDANDLARHNNNSISSRMIDRIINSGVTRKMRMPSENVKPNRMTYTEFVYFLLSDEDKHHPTAIEYWFRLMDLDGDGMLSMYELQYFYEEQVQRIESLDIDSLPFADCICQMLDMIKPVRSGLITLGDLKRCKLTPIFFDTFFNFEKFLENEQRDPFSSLRDSDDQLSDWDRFAQLEYEYLVAEDSNDTQGYDEEYDYEITFDVIDTDTQTNEDW